VRVRARIIRFDLVAACPTRHRAMYMCSQARIESTACVPQPTGLNGLHRPALVRVSADACTLAKRIATCAALTCSFHCYSHQPWKCADLRRPHGVRFQHTPCLRVCACVCPCVSIHENPTTPARLTRPPAVQPVKTDCQWHVHRRHPPRSQARRLHVGAAWSVRPCMPWAYSPPTGHTFKDQVLVTALGTTARVSNVGQVNVCAHAQHTCLS
jgi:hypothetical protein